jgi:hypothetical protein
LGLDSLLAFGFLLPVEGPEGQYRHHRDKDEAKGS